MEIEVMVYGFVEVSVVDNEVIKEVYYFASEETREEVLMQAIAENLDGEFYRFEKVEYVEV